MRAFRILEFQSMQAYEAWLAQMGKRVQVIHLTTQRERWLLRDGVACLDKTPTYRVTFREAVPNDESVGGKRCLTCGATSSPEYKFCEICGAPLFRPVPPTQT
jgi:hypothetical protein